MKRVLIVDDNEENRYLLTALLEGSGFEVDTARHGAEALALAKRSRPDVVVSDLLMPVMDGYTLLGHWKRDERLRPVPFVVYTATYTDPGDEKLALDLGADAFLVKPAEPELFLERLRGILDRRAREAPLEPRSPVPDQTAVLEEYNAALVRKLEKKAFELERTNRELHDDVARREVAERRTRELLAGADRARTALLGILEDVTASREELREVSERLSLVVTGTGTGLWDWDLATDRVRYSREWKGMLGYAEDEIGDHLDEWRRLAHPDDVEPAFAGVAAYLERPKGTHQAEFRMRARSGEWRWILSRATAIRGADGRPVRLLGLHVDITERKRIEAELAASQRRFELLFERGPYPTALARFEDGALIEVNAEFERFFGFTREEARGRTSLELGIHPDAATRSRLLAEVQATGGARDREAVLCTRSGERRAVVLNVDVVESAGERFILSVTRDVTEQKRVEAALQAMPRRLLAAQEEERRRVAGELHDELGQLLTAAKLNLQAAAREPAAPTSLASASEAVERAIASVRRLALDLRPSLLDDLGLVPALRWLLDRAGRDAGLATELAVTWEERLPPEIETVCFRVAQEALTNIVRHAAASSVRVALARGDGHLRLSVRDDGRGFDIAAALAAVRGGASVGLAGMRERVALVGGTFELVSRPGAGCEVVAVVPIGIAGAVRAVGSEAGT